MMKLQMRLVYSEGQVGPGKIVLLEAIRETGSISAAARTLGMSYRRAWYLIDTMNKAFGQPLVKAAAGGASGGGAELTALGVDLVRRYRALETETDAALHRLFGDFPSPSADGTDP